MLNDQDCMSTGTGHVPCPATTRQPDIRLHIIFWKIAYHRRVKIAVRVNLSTAYKTETYPLKNVYRASMQALRVMAIRVHAVDRKEPEITIKAAAGKRKVTLILETITPVTTRVTTNVSRSLILSDKATAEEIIRQMSLALQKSRASRLNHYSTLAVNVDPPDATIRILNIKPRFYQGIVLKEGVYDLQVSAKKYKSKKILTTLRPGQDKIIQVSLDKLK